MSLVVFAAVLAAACLHALWNAMAKGGSDKLVSMAAIVSGHVPVAVLLAAYLPMPVPESWPYIAASMGLHVGYQYCLLRSYRIGDLTQVYPIARGIAPLIVALVSILFLGVALSLPEMIAIALIGSGIVSLGLVRSKTGLRNPAATAFAITTGCFIAAYSLNDGTGARLSGEPIAFYAWASLGNALIFLAGIRILAPGTLSRMRREAGRTLVIGANASFLAYAIVVWAFTEAPIALVTALRETSILFALLIGVFVLKERLDLAKVISTFVTIAGAALLRVSK
ncbi:DMT family transporter [Fulvimarina sp. MAC8]|uniref:DMT family transporter n=1 Tax=Fulvimarina sp. MAC8 TaxID=3162874 RepID=UPI0032EBB728